MNLHEKLLDVANRLSQEGRHDDAAIVYAAAFQNAPLPKPTIESLSTWQEEEA